MSRRGRIGLVVFLVLALLGGPLAPAAVAGQAPAAGADALVYVFSNSSPHVSVIDAATRQVVETADVPDFTAWTWNDDNNHFDGTRLWLGLRNPDTDDVEVIALDLETLGVAHRVPLGTDTLNLYIGKAADGILNVGKQGSGQVVAIDTAAAAVQATWDVPVNGDVVCDADVSTDAAGRQRFVYPTREGDTVVTLDPATGEVLKEVATPAGSTPLMLTTAGDGTIWVQDSGSNTNSIYDPDLNLIERVPSAQGPIVATFSPDGAFAYIGHSGDPIVQVIETATFAEVERVRVGTNPTKIGVHPAGGEIYAILTEEAALAVVETGSWSVVDRIPLGTNPSGIFVRPASA